MKKDTDKTKAQLLAELAELRKKSKEQEDKLKAANQQLDAQNQQLEASNIEIRKRETEALADKEYAENIIQTLREPLLILDADLKVISANASFYKTFKFSQRDTEGKFVYELGNHQWDIPELKKLLLEILPDKSEIVDFEVEHLFEDIGQKTMLLNAKELIQEQGKPKRILLAIEDITERKQAEDKLKAANQQLDAQNQQLQASQQTLKTQAYQLGEQLKKLNCLHSISESIRTRETIEEILQDITEVIPPSWQYPQITGSKITLWDKEYKTENYKDSQWKLSSDIRVNKKIAGKIEVCYLGKKPESDIGPFLNEERILLDVIAERLGRIIERKNAEEALKVTNQQLRAANQQLDAQNQQLQAIEQQLRAANQQLQETSRQKLLALNQQLKAQNQQLQTSEEALKASEERLDLAMMIKNEGIWDWNLVTNQVDFDERYYTMAGYEPGDFANNLEEFQKRVHPEDVDYVMSTAEQYLAGQIEQFQVEFRFKRKDGTWMWILARGQIVERDEKGIPLRFIGTHSDITKRKQAELALQKSEAKFRAIAQTASDAIISVDSSGKIMVWNHGAEQLFGYSEQEISGKPLTLLMPERFQKAHKKSFSRVKSGGNLNLIGKTVELTGIRKDGQEVPIEISLAKWEIGEELYFSAVIRDITERKWAEKELTKLSTAVTQSPSVIAITDSDGNLEYVNSKLTEITGYSQEEVIGRKPSIWSSGEHPAEMYKELWETISSGKTWRGEIHNKKKNGELYWTLSSISPIFDEKGKIINYVNVAEDITERKRNEQIQSIIHNISNAVITSHSLEKFLTLVKEELGKLIDTTNFFVALYDEETDSISLLMHRDEKDKVETFPAGKTLTNYVIKTGKSLLAKKAMIEKLIKSGEVEQIGHLSEVWLGVPLKSENKVTGIFAVQSYDNENAFDETDVKMLEIISHQISLSLERLKAEEDLKLAKEKAEENNRLKTAFLNNMSHEIRTPLNAITGFINLLQDPEIDEEEKQQYFDIINKSSDRLIATVTDIIDISKIEAGAVKISKNEVSVNEILEEQYRFFYHEAQSKGIELIYKPTLPDSQARVITDKHKLEGILTNLIKNAIKYTETGEITFGCRLIDKEFIEFYVKDTGIGIPANRMEAIFNRFEQADIGDSRVFEGSGLGLAIAKSYVEMLGGKIWVESQEGKGSTFYFTLPVKEKNSEKLSKPIEASSEKKIKPGTKKLKILIAEDDETTLSYVSIILQDFIYELLKAKNGIEAVELCRKNQDIDLILMDIKMPGMDGYEATRRIREFNNDVVIIAQTAYALSDDREKAIAAGCNDYIAKPVKKELLIEKIWHV